MDFTWVVFRLGESQDERGVAGKYAGFPSVGRKFRAYKRMTPETSRGERRLQLFLGRILTPRIYSKRIVLGSELSSIYRAIVDIVTPPQEKRISGVH